MNIQFGIGTMVDVIDLLIMMAIARYDLLYKEIAFE